MQGGPFCIIGLEPQDIFAVEAARYTPRASHLVCPFIFMRIVGILLGILAVDQYTKFSIASTMYRGQSTPLLGDWFKLTFTENPGVAFGFVFGSPLTVTLFALGATLIIIAYFTRVQRYYRPYSTSLLFIIGGALGNLTDRIFYGPFWGYGGWFEGRVVDFVHLDLWHGYLPASVPLIGGTPMALLPIWNLADMAIIAGVIGLLVHQGGFHAALIKAASDAAAGAEVPAAEGIAEPELAPVEVSPVAAPDGPTGR